MQLRQSANSILKFSTQCLTIEVPGGSLFRELSFETFIHTITHLADAVPNIAHSHSTALAVFWVFLEVDGEESNIKLLAL